MTVSSRGNTGAGPTSFKHIDLTGHLELHCAGANSTRAEAGLLIGQMNHHSLPARRLPDSQTDKSRLPKVTSSSNQSIAPPDFPLSLRSTFIGTTPAFHTCSLDSQVSSWPTGASRTITLSSPSTDRLSCLLDKLNNASRPALAADEPSTQDISMQREATFGESREHSRMNATPQSISLRLL